MPGLGNVTRVSDASPTVRLLLRVWVCLAGFGASLHAQSDTLFAEGFEANTFPVRALGPGLDVPDFEQALPGWSFPHYWKPKVCGCDDPRDRGAEYYQHCDGYPTEAHGGCEQLMLEYGTFFRDPGQTTYGGSSYLTRTLEEPLELGRLYRLSMWVYLPAKHGARGDSIARHFGAQFFAKRVLPQPFGVMYRGSQLRIDTVIHDAWHRVRWTFKPMCELRYLVLGVFRDNAGPPVRRPELAFRYFVDDVVLERLPEASAEQLAEAIGVCRFTEQQLANTYPPAAERVAIYFASNSAELSDSARLALDAYADAVRPYRELTFTVRGYADRASGDNQALSEQRIDAVVDYLAEQHCIVDFRFVRLPFADSKSRSTVDSRDRRAEIRLVESEHDGTPYRNAIEATRRGDFSAAVRALRMWQTIVPEKRRWWIAYDPRLTAFRESPAYAYMEEYLNAEYAKLGHAAFAKTLLALYAADQRYRTLGPRIENLSAYYRELDSLDKRWDVRFEATDEQVRLADSTNAASAIAFVEANGWPLLSQVGERAASAVPLALMHNGEPEQMRAYLHAFEAACMAGEAEWRYFAMLTDRALLAEGQLQRYGTQYRHAEGRAPSTRLPVRDERETQMLRAMLGLNGDSRLREW